MRIGLFTDSYPPYVNGVSTSVETLKNTLEDLGHEVYVVTVGQDSVTYDFDEEKRILKVPGIPLGIYDYRVASIYPLKVVNKIRSWNLEVIHSHTELCMGIFARLFAKQFGIPLVHTYHTMYKDYTYYVSRNHKYFDLGCKKAVQYLSKFYCDSTATCFIVPTIKTYKMFREEYHYDKDIYIVPTGVDSSRFLKKNIDKDKISELKKSLGYTKNDFVVIFVGRLAQEKNIEYILRVMEIINRKKKNIKLLIVGDGPDKEKYEKYADELEISDYVKFVGRVPWEETPYYYHSSDVFLSASVTETQGLTVIEGMASGLPALCISDDAFKTMVVDKFNGRLFDSEGECASIIMELASDKKQVEILAKQAVITASKFSPEAFGREVLNVYNDAIVKYNDKHKFSSMVRGFIDKKRKDKDEEE